MNVDEAIAKWKDLREQYDWNKYSPTLTDIFVAEVERLRAELAAAKAASVVPVEITRLYSTDWGLSLKVECRSEDDCETLWKWLRNQKRERGEG